MVFEVRIRDLPMFRSRGNRSRDVPTRTCGMSAVISVTGLSVAPPRIKYYIHVLQGWSMSIPYIPERSQQGKQENRTGIYITRRQ